MIYLVSNYNLKYLLSFFCSVSNSDKDDCDSETAWESAVSAKSNKHSKLLVPPQRLSAWFRKFVLLPKSVSILSKNSGTNVGS